MTAEPKKSTVAEENRVQLEAWEQCECPDMLKLIDLYAEDFRRIITEFKEEYGRLPTANELIWCESYDTHHDITKEK